MPYPPHYLLAFGGHLGDSATNELEHWSCTLRMQQQGSLAQVIGNDVESSALDDLTSDVQSFIQDPNLSCSNATWLSWVKFNAINESGRYAKNYTNERHFTPVAGPATSNYLPWQCSVVVTTTTDVKRGRAHAGRMFLPPLGFINQRNGLMANNGPGSIALAMKTFLNNVNNWPGLDTTNTINARAVVVSKIDGSSHPITGVRVGQVVDTHRSRRRSLSENYSVLALS